MEQVKPVPQFERTVRDSLRRGVSADDLYRNVVRLSQQNGPSGALEDVGQLRAAEMDAQPIDMPEALLKERSQFERLPSGDRRRNLEKAYWDTLNREIYGKRLPRILEDITDYARRQVFTFTREDGDAERYSGSHWMSDEDMNRTMLSLGGRGSRSKATEEVEGKICLTLGQCLTRAVDDIAARQLSDRSTFWIFYLLNYSLDWVLYGIGTPKLNRYAPQDLDWELPKVTGMDRVPTLAMLKTLRTTTSWTSMEWSWLLGTTTRTQYRCTYPTLPLAARIVNSWGIEPCAPLLPEPPVFVNWLWKWLAGEFVAEGGTPAQEKWKQDIISTCVRSKTRLYLLLGVTTQSGSQYGREIMAPSASITRACYYIEMVVRRWGREGFLNILDILDQEARDRGFEGLPGVFEKRTWNFRNKKFKQAKPVAEKARTAKPSSAKAPAARSTRTAAPVAAVSIDAAMAAMKQDLAKLEGFEQQRATQIQNPLDTVRVVHEQKKSPERIEEAEGPAIKVRKGRGKKAVRR